MKLYEIDQQIEQLIDFESGEITDFEKLEELQMERNQKVENIACFIKNLTADIAELKQEEKSLSERRKVKENKVEYLKNFLKYALNGTKFETAKCAVSFRKSVACNIIDESAIADEYKTVEQVVKIDKKAITDAIKSGELVDGAELVENSNIQVK